MQSTETVQEKNTHLDQKRGALIERRIRLLQSFRRATELQKSRRMETICKQLQQINEFLESLEKIKAEAQSKAVTASAHQYVVSSLFLHQCFKDLTADKDEQFFFITGSEMDGRFVLDQKLSLPIRREMRWAWSATPAPPIGFSSN